ESRSSHSGHDVIRSNGGRPTGDSRGDYCWPGKWYSAACRWAGIAASRGAACTSARDGTGRFWQDRSDSLNDMARNVVKVGLVQTKVGSDLHENLDKTASFIKQAARKGADIVCLHELFAYRYFAQTKDDRFFDIAEPVPGPLSHFLEECASANRVFLV